MSKVRTFSQKFPSYHKRKGQDTNFVEKIWLWLVNIDGYSYPEYHEEYKDLVDIMDILKQEYTKRHTVRAGKHFKSGDFFSPRIWTGKPYVSKQRAIAFDLQLKKVYDFKIEIVEDLVTILIDNKIFYEENKNFCTQYSALEYLAKNDGLSVEDFKEWFKWGKIPFDGQILCWADDVEY